jgi:hypothetical protein
MEAIRAGFGDACNIRRLILVLLTSGKCTWILMELWMLNGFLFLGTLGLLRIMGGQYWLACFFIRVLWLYPVYLILFMLNSSRYTRLVQYLNERTRQTPGSDRRTGKSVEEKIYRMLWISIGLVQVNLIYFMPLIGQWLSFLLSCFIYAFYSFEYCFTTRLPSTAAQIKYIERNYVYFMAFGFPLTLLTFFVQDVLVAMALFWLLFPLNLILSFFATPRQHSPRLPASLPIFHTINYMHLHLLQQIHNKLLQT